MALRRCVVMDASPSPTWPRSPTSCAQWQTTGRSSAVYARTHCNTVGDWAGSSPRAARPHAEITDPGRILIAVRVRCTVRCAVHTPRQHRQATLAPQHSTRPLLMKALGSSSSSAAPSLQRRQGAAMVRSRMSCAKSRSLNSGNMCSSRESVQKSDRCHLR